MATPFLCKSVYANIIRRKYCHSNSTVEISLYVHLCLCTQESDLIENVEEDKDSDTAKTCDEEKSKIQVIYVKYKDHMKPYLKKEFLHVLTNENLLTFN